ncbi:hypothetical protein [Actinomadura macrotermitis]|nr:hypothetical protein [Actinomadura macrotermitis]
MKRLAAAAAAAACALLAAPAPAHAAPASLHPVALPFLWPNADLYDVDAVSPAKVWAAGRQGAFCAVWVPWTPCAVGSNGNPVIRQWTGSAWKEYPINGWQGQGAVVAVGGTATETWAASGNSTPQVFRFDGTAFQPVAAPAGHTYTWFRASAAGAWARVEGLAAPLYRRSGNAWQEASLPGTFANLIDLQGRAADDAYAVGTGYRTGGFGYPTLAHWDGAAWHEIPVPEDMRPSTVNFTAVVPGGPGEAWLIGPGALVHLKDGAWTRMTVPVAGEDVLDLAPAGDGTLWALSGAEPAAGRPYRYVDGVWEAATVPTGARPHRLAVVPGTGKVWAVAADASGKPLVLTDS